MRRKWAQTQTLKFLPGFRWQFEHACSMFFSSQVHVSMRPLFGVHSKIWTAIFVCLYIFLAGVQLTVFLCAYWSEMRLSICFLRFYLCFCIARQQTAKMIKSQTRTASVWYYKIWKRHSNISFGSQIKVTMFNYI